MHGNLDLSPCLVSSLPSSPADPRPRHAWAGAWRAARAHGGAPQAACDDGVRKRGARPATGGQQGDKQVLRLPRRRERGRGMRHAATAGAVRAERVHGNSARAGRDEPVALPLARTTACTDERLVTALRRVCCERRVVMAGATGRTASGLRGHGDDDARELARPRLRSANRLRDGGNVRLVLKPADKPAETVSL